MILSGTGDIDQLNRTRHRAEVFGTMLKPWNDEFLMAMIAEALTHRDLQLEKLQLEKRPPALQEAPAGAAPSSDNPPPA